VPSSVRRSKAARVAKSLPHASVQSGRAAAWVRVASREWVVLKVWVDVPRARVAQKVWVVAQKARVAQKAWVVAQKARVAQKAWVVAPKARVAPDRPVRQLAAVSRPRPTRLVARLQPQGGAREKAHP
jgi:hypothetical protein